MKFLTKRLIESHILSQEEFSTNLAEIKMVLNSRPLIAASDEQKDFSVITPGHFLIGSELKSVPEPYYISEKIGGNSCTDLPVVLEIMVKGLFDSVASGASAQ
ncbi:uncharacterized protein NPIL_620371 [Nephila pilipes]|uniref:Uncharacterized protein n=1 Tax=Nephila pilipes TaxID=299642 RepID=A0A8X6MPT7_NEPPI|nr:uncharacterized protein NPIL_620371 [Nephila pilipes]